MDEPQKTYEIRKSTLQANRLQRTTLDGREYAVAPVVALVAGVVNGELITAEELGAFVAAWDGRPVPVQHPQDAEGNYVSANSPEVIETSVIGQVFKMAMAGDRLVGEVWLDVAKCQKLGGDALATLQRLEAGQIVEVSTAYFCDIEEVTGTFNGAAYTGIQRNLRPDHVALLPDQVGACSVANGCGAGRTNALRANADLDFTDAIMVAFYLRPADAEALALLPDDLPAGSQVLAASELHITLAYLGTLDDATTEFNRVAQALAEYAEDMVAVLATTAGYGRFTAAEGDMDAMFALVDSEAVHQQRFWLADMLRWELDFDVTRRWGFIPHVTLGYVPTATPVALPPTPRYSLVLDRIALSWGEQVIEFPLRGEVRSTAVTAINRCRCSEENMNEQEKKQAKAGQAKATANEEAQQATEAAAGTATAVATGTLQMPELPPELTELATAVREFGGVGALMEAVRGIKANNDRQRTQIVSRLAGNSRCAFSKDELDAMRFEQLVKLEASIVPAAQSYLGRNGAGMAANQGDELRPYKGAAATEAKAQ